MLKSNNKFDIDDEIHKLEEWFCNMKINYTS